MKYFVWFVKTVLFSLVTYEIARVWGNYRRISVGLKTYSGFWYDSGIFLLSFLGGGFAFFMQGRRNPEEIQKDKQAIEKFIRNPFSLKGAAFALIFVISLKFILGLFLASVMTQSNIWAEWLDYQRLIWEFPLLYCFSYLASCLYFYKKNLKD